MRVCKINGCDKRRYTSLYCLEHYRMPPACMRRGCYSDIHRSGLCREHYALRLARRRRGRAKMERRRRAMRPVTTDVDVCGAIFVGRPCPTKKRGPDDVPDTRTDCVIYGGCLRAAAHAGWMAMSCSSCAGPAVVRP